jgi:deazaflavin-dependent oxidoreductase (nitroreductase family)
MPLTGEYEPSIWDWVREQVETYERTGGAEANTLRETGIPIVIITTKGAKSGKLRKFALMRVEHDGEYALVASKGGAPDHPGWYHNIVGEPLVMIQDGPEPRDYRAEIVTGDERAECGNAAWREMRPTPSTRRRPTARTRSSSPVRTT